jgi:hypothetical protein
MTIPFYIEQNHNRIEVPQEILYYCDHFTVDSNREDLRYLDCVYMNLGYYGNDLDTLKKMRDEFFSKPLPVFE